MRSALTYSTAARLALARRVTCSWPLSSTFTTLTTVL